MPAEPLFLTDARAVHCRAVVTGVFADSFTASRTVFYARGGGQPGDVGEAVVDGDSFKILEAHRKDGDIHHPLTAPPPPDWMGKEIELRIDAPRRLRLMRTHTALHLLSAAVPAPITGGSVGELRGRIDFDLEGALDREAAQNKLDEFVRANAEVRARWMDEEEFLSRPELVKTTGVQPPRGAGRIRLVDIYGIDLQACGGTHVSRTAEVGAARIAKVEKKGRRNRRVVVDILDALENN